MAHINHNLCETSKKPSTHPPTAQAQEQPPREQYELRTCTLRKKCHGNQKLQHFKRKCRSRGLGREQITTLINKRDHTISEQSPTVPIISEQSHQTHKRKRDNLSIENLSNISTKSMSQLSIASLTVTKKIKHSTTIPHSMDHPTDDETNSLHITFYKASKYLKMPRRFLLHSLHLQLHCRLKRKEAIFVLSRLNILDQQFCVEQIHSLYQVYADIGSTNHVWLVSARIHLFYVPISRNIIFRMIFFESYPLVNPV
jgi:hypothetical protein